MTLELRILTGSRAGKRERFDQSVVAIGRNPASDLRFDPEADLEVSSRHAEVRRVGDDWRVKDTLSTNGTFLNGERLTDEKRLNTGDVLSFGATGPQVEVRIGGTTPMTVMEQPAHAAPRRDTTVRIAEAVTMQTKSLRRKFAVTLGGFVVLAVTAFAMWQRRTNEREHALLALIARSESTSVPLQAMIGAMRARDSLFSRALAERDSASAREVAAGRKIVDGSHASAASVALLSQRMALETRLRQAITQMDFPRVHDLNDGAVALVASDLDGTFIAGTAFAISPQGQLITNRHVMRSDAGNPPRRIRVLFANTTEWRNAKLVRTSDTDDLALLQVEGRVTVPVVAGVSRTGSDTRVGSPIATIGYPHAVDTPMEGTGLNVRARTTTTAGTVSKRLADVLQIDSYAGKGSSGSPVFDVHGEVVGVIYGGAPESNGRIVYAVPAERLAAFIAQTPSAAILR